MIRRFFETDEDYETYLLAERQAIDSIRLEKYAAEIEKVLKEHNKETCQVDCCILCFGESERP